MKRLLDHLLEIIMGENRGGHVHRDVQVERLVAVPVGSLAAGGPQHPFGERPDQPRLFGKRHEAARAQHPQVRMVPAHQRLDPDDAHGGGVEFRLVQQEQLAAGDGAQQPMLQLNPLVALFPPLAAVKAEGRASLLLGLVQCRVGHLEELHRLLGIRRVQGDADTDAGLDRFPLDLDRCRDRFQNPLGDDARAVRHVGLAQQHGELVSADPGHDIFAAHGAVPQPPGRLDKERIPREMASPVVDRLEAVQVEKKQGERFFAPLGEFDGLGQEVVEGLAVVEAGEAVARGLLPDEQLACLVPRLYPCGQQIDDRRHRGDTQKFQ